MFALIRSLMPGCFPRNVDRNLHEVDADANAPCAERRACHAPAHAGTILGAAGTVSELSRGASFGSVAANRNDDVPINAHARPQGGVSWYYELSRLASPWR